ncbi:MAG: lipoyl(octanoyl) transferase LipB [Candidatus Bipolaricaulota bacterium]|nr:lipoyl(octanoyl) transferase LipB [Candidatus Bipolaricaulota bacterium]MDW8141112.1 lipoyl(octanoyl) transferase LipB [Candidatus Bipolaricaulota bacterium]
MLEILDLGTREYREVWELQHELVARRIAGEIGDILVLVEHPPVFTVGRAASRAVPKEIENIPCWAIERGGQITYHGPGQLVGYPILDLRARGRDLPRYLRDLEDVLMLTLVDFGIAAERCPGLTGVWVKKRKIASIGIAVKRWVSYHGFALNVSVDLRYFRAIQPCGLDGSVMTSMAEQLGRSLELETVKPPLVKRFQEIFGGL